MTQGIIWTQFDSKISRYFSVGEVTQWDTKRIPKDPLHQQNIIILSKELDKIRDAWGSPIKVTSWYRPLNVNRAIGSSDNSQHVLGKAADISPLFGNLDKFEQWLDANWFGALGYGQRARRGFTHVDNRNNKGWGSGGSKSARWHY
jgi:uncharacterized protein YcbK (DUF882 family)